MFNFIGNMMGLCETKPASSQMEIVGIPDHLLQFLNTCLAPDVFEELPLVFFLTALVEHINILNNEGKPLIRI